MSQIQSPQGLSVNESFQQALSLQNQNKLDEALASYQKILDQGLENAQELSREQASAISHNMSLLYFQKKEAALSSIYNQKALFLNDRNSVALEFQKQNKNLLQTTSIPRDIPFIENANLMGLKYLSIEFLFAVVAVLMAVVLKNVFTFFLERKKADLLNSSEAVQFKVINYFWMTLFVCFSTLLIIKVYDFSSLRVIIKTAGVVVQAAPGENQATVTQAEIGTILKVLKLSNDADLAYVQIKYPGAYSGWVKRADLELLNSTFWPVSIDKK